jgi:hypothetical protein
VRILALEGGQVMGALPLDDTRAFTLSFTHSMYGGSVAETYEVLWDQSLADSTLQLSRTTVRTQNGAAAEYYARYGNFVRDGDSWRVDAPHLTLPYVRMRVDGTGQPELVSGRERLALLSLVPDGSLVEIRPVATAGGNR